MYLRGYNTCAKISSMALHFWQIHTYIVCLRPVCNALICAGCFYTDKEKLFWKSFGFKSYSTFKCVSHVTFSFFIIWFDFGTQIN